MRAVLFGGQGSSYLPNQRVFYLWLIKRESERGKTQSQVGPFLIWKGTTPLSPKMNCKHYDIASIMTSRQRHFAGGLSIKKAESDYCTQIGCWTRSNLIAGQKGLKNWPCSDFGWLMAFGLWSRPLDIRSFKMAVSLECYIKHKIFLFM